MASKILMVEDDKSLTAAIQTEFEAEGFEFDSIETTAKALERTQAIHPDLVLLDLMLPDGDGLTFLGKIKADPKLKDIPVVVLTNFGDEESVKKALEGGAEDFLLKYKVVPTEVVEKVKGIVGRSESAGVPVTSE